MYNSSKDADQRGREVCVILKDRLDGDWSHKIENHGSKWMYHCYLGNMRLFEDNNEFSCFIAKRDDEKGGWTQGEANSADPGECVVRTLRFYKKYAIEMIERLNKNMGLINI